MKIKRKVLNYSVEFINEKLKNSGNENLKKIRLKKLAKSIIDVQIYHLFVHFLYFPF